jgi:hypothetical protein
MLVNPVRVLPANVISRVIASFQQGFELPEGLPGRSQQRNEH